MKFLFVLYSAHAACTSPTGVAGQLQYITANSDFEFCNGTNWVSSLVAPTANTCTTAGMIQYMTGSSDLQYCDGNVWNSMSSSLANGTCSGTTAGTYRYNTSNSWYEWCDGASWKVMYAQPTLSLDFTKGTLPIQVQFSRASGSNVSPGTYFNSSGVLTTTAQQNLIQYSQVYGAPWGLSYQSATANAATAPDGTTNASKIVDTTGGTTSSVHYVAQGVSLVTGTSYCMSGYLKAGERNILRLATSGSFSPFNYVDVNLNTGVVLGGSFGTSGLTSVGNGWYRIYGCATHTGSSGVNGGILFQANNGSSFGYVGDGTSGYYLWGAQLEIGTASTNYIYTAGAGSYGPRFDYDPSNCSGGTCAARGLLIEQGSKNLVQYSGNLTNSWWGLQGGATSSTSTATTPDGSTSATTLTGPGYLNVPNQTIPNDSTYWSCSVFLQQGTSASTEVKANLWGGTGVTSYAQIIWATKSVTYKSGTYFLQNVGNGWYRLTSVVQNNSSGNTTGSCYVTPDISNSSGTVLAWGEQMENLPTPTSYIPTNGAALTRGSDQAAYPTSAGSWFNASQGTMVASFSVTSVRPETNQFAYDLDDGTGSNRMGLRTIGNSTSAAMEDVVGGTSLMAQGFGGMSLSAANYGAFGYQAGNLGMSFNGSATITSTAASIPTVTTLQLGQYHGNSQYLNGWLRTFTYYNTRLTNSQIKQLATYGLP